MTKWIYTHLQLTPPNSLIGPMRDLFVEQERSRYNMRLQHLIQRVCI